MDLRGYTLFEELAYIRQQLQNAEKSLEDTSLGLNVVDTNIPVSNVFGKIQRALTNVRQTIIWTDVQMGDAKYNK